MTWHELAMLIVGVSHRFAVPVSGITVGGTQNPDALGELLLDTDEENKTHFERCIRDFAKTGEWPELSDLQKLVPYIRCRNALWFINQLSTYMSDFPMTGVFPVSEPPPETPREVLVMWLLDSMWQNYRKLWMPEAVRELLGEQRM